MTSRISRALLFCSAILLGVSCSEPRQGEEGAQATPEAPTPLEVTYIANDGFLIAAGPSKVMIDALQENPWEYHDTPEEVFQMMMADEAPFDGVDLLIASHHHADHFSAHLVSPYLAQHPEVVFITSQHAVDTLAEFAGDGFREIEGQVRNVNPAWGASEEVTAGGIHARLLTLNHVPPDYEEGPFLTLGSLVTLEGRKILHLADMVPESTVAYLEGYGLAEEEIDVLFADPFFVLDEVGQGLIRDHIHPQHIVLMHLPPAEHEQYREQVAPLFPDAVIFTTPMETRVFQ